jgi:hypothetical protein
MMPQIHASEQLDAIRAVSIGGAHMEKDAREAALRKLELTAQGGQRQRARKAKAGDLRAMGIGAKVVPAKLKANSDG